MAVKVVVVPGLEDALERIVSRSALAREVADLTRRVEELERRNAAPEGGKGD